MAGTVTVLAVVLKGGEIVEQEKDKVAGGYTLIPDSISSIPATELSMIEKVLLCRIISLSKDKPCEISNAALASRFGVTGRRITGHIAGLKQKGWIDVTGPRTKRYIRPTSKALSLWTFPSIDGNIYRRNHLETETSSTIDGNVLNYGRNRLPKNTENTESTDIRANDDLRMCAPSQNRKAEREGQTAKEERFSMFWAAYPKKRDKARARRSFFKIKNIEKIFPVMMQALEKQKASADWQKANGQYIPNPSTWLNGERWEDVEQVDVQPVARGPVNLTTADIERREREQEQKQADNMAELLRRMEQEGGT